MNENRYLNEEKYKKAEKTLTLVSIIILIVGFCIGGFLVYKGVAKPDASKVEDLKAQLETKKNELESAGISFDGFTKYSDGKAYDLKIITNALDPSFNYCNFDEYKNNSITKDYCAAKNSGDGFASTGFIIGGAFVCFTACIISGAIFMMAKQRQIIAFQAQQVMPVAKEGIEEMSPTLGKAAKDISRGIAEGVRDSRGK